MENHHFGMGRSTISMAIFHLSSPIAEARAGSKLAARRQKTRKTRWVAPWTSPLDVKGNADGNPWEIHGKSEDSVKFRGSYERNGIWDGYDGDLYVLMGHE